MSYEIVSGVGGCMMELLILFVLSVATCVVGILLVEVWILPSLSEPRDDELARMMSEISATTKVLQELNADLAAIIAEKAERKPCPVCGYLRMSNEMEEPPTEEPIPAVPPGGHWELVWVDRSVSTTGRTLWQNPFDSTYTVTRGDDA